MTIENALNAVQDRVTSLLASVTVEKDEEQVPFFDISIAHEVVAQKDDRPRVLITVEEIEPISDLDASGAFKSRVPFTIRVSAPKKRGMPLFVAEQAYKLMIGLHQFHTKVSRTTPLEVQSAYPDPFSDDHRYDVWKLEASFEIRAEIDIPTEGGDTPTTLAYADASGLESGVFDET